MCAFVYSESSEFSSRRKHSEMEEEKFKNITKLHPREILNIGLLFIWPDAFLHTLFSFTNA